MAIRFSNIPLILAAVAILLLSADPAATTAASNVLLTGQTLGPGGRLTSAGGMYSVIMTPDCDLVIRNHTGTFSISNSKGKGSNCSLAFSANGRLRITDFHPNVGSNSTTIWNTPNFYSQIGSYAAVLKSDGEFATYGPSPWQSPAAAVSKPRKYRSSTDGANNILFSGQILEEGKSSLEDWPYKLALSSPCSFAVEEAGNGPIWQQKPNSNGRSCFVRLNHYGQLSLVDDLYLTLWSSYTHCALLDEGEYVLVMQYNGRAGVYGRKIWNNIQGIIDYYGGIRKVTGHL